MKLNIFTLVLWINFAAHGQNIGLGTVNPQSLLHLSGSESISSSRQATFRISNTAEGGSTWFLRVGSSGNGFLQAALGLQSISSAVPAVIISSNNRVGIGFHNVSPSERLQINGNIRLDASDKGIILNSADRPLITRGFDPFSSGIYEGLGRWGVFMEASNLTLGIPHLDNKRIQFVTYNPNSTINARFMSMHFNDFSNSTFTNFHSNSVNFNSSKVNTTQTGTTHMLPIAYGRINANGGVPYSSGNVTATKVNTGVFNLFITGVTSTVHLTMIATSLSEQPRIVTQWIGEATNYIRINIYNQNGSLADASFNFVIYNPLL